MRPEQAKPVSRVVKQGGNTLWHQLQRSWAFVRVGKAIFPRWFVSKEVALYPGSTRDEFGIEVTVDKIKQGTFDARPATLLIFSALFGDIPALKEVCFEIRCLLKNKHSSPPAVLYAGAFGPSYVTEWRVTNNPIPNSDPLPATITARPFRRGILVVARSGRPGHGGVPRLLRFGLVVVHSGEADLMAFPSKRRETGDCLSSYTHNANSSRFGARSRPFPHNLC